MELFRTLANEAGMLAIIEKAIDNHVFSLRWVLLGWASCAALLPFSTNCGGPVYEVDAPSVDAPSDEGDDVAPGDTTAVNKDTCNVSCINTLCTQEIFDVERVPISPLDPESKYGSGHPVLSADGRFVAFGVSGSMFGGETKGNEVIVYDRQDDAFEVASVSTSGDPANDSSWGPSISNDGRFVAFATRASNLVEDDTNGIVDAFVRDRWNETTVRVSVSSSGAEGTLSPRNFELEDPTLSPDGRYVVFTSWANGLVPGDQNDDGDVFLHDIQSGETVWLSSAPLGEEPDSWSYAPTVSKDASYVAFTSWATNLAPGGLLSEADMFIWENGQEGLQLVDLLGDLSGTISDGKSHITTDGRLLVLHSWLPTMRGLIVYDRNKGMGSLLFDESDKQMQTIGTRQLAVSGDARYVLFSGNREPDGSAIFVADRLCNTLAMLRLSTDDEDSEFAPRFFSLSSNGQWIAFSSKDPLNKNTDILVGRLNGP